MTKFTLQIEMDSSEEVAIVSALADICLNARSTDMTFRSVADAVDYFSLALSDLIETRAAQDGLEDMAGPMGFMSGCLDNVRNTMAHLIEHAE